MAKYLCLPEILQQLFCSHPPLILNTPLRCGHKIDATQLSRSCLFSNQSTLLPVWFGSVVCTKKVSQRSASLANLYTPTYMCSTMRGNLATLLWVSFSSRFTGLVKLHLSMSTLTALHTGRDGFEVFLLPLCTWCPLWTKKSVESIECKFSIAVSYIPVCMCVCVRRGESQENYW